MGSLFDLAAELSQYSDTSDREPSPVSAPEAHAATWKPPHSSLLASKADRPVNTSNQEGDGVLSLLDETLHTIYAVRQPHRAPASALTAQHSSPQLLASSTFAIEDRDSRPRASTPTSASTSSPLQSVFAQSLALSSAGLARAVPPPPSAPPPVSTQGKNSVAMKVSSQTTEDPDMTARRTLREIQEELEQLPEHAVASPTHLQRLQRSLSDKYLLNRLNKLPPTPFVQLARKKTQQKIDQLEDKLEPAAPKPEATSATPLAPTIGIFPPDQHDMLVKLALIPDSHIAKLSATQQQTVQFAKRYNKILRLSNDDLRELPVSQAQLLHQLQQQMKH